MVVKLKHIENAVADDGSLVRGNLYHTRMTGPTGGNCGHRIWEFGTTKNYALGARFVTEDGRVFRYAKAGGILISGQGCKSESPLMVPHTVGVVGAALATSLALTVTQSDGGIAGDGVFAVNVLEGGYICIFDKSDTNNVVFRKILSNTVKVATGTTMTITIDDPIPNTLVAADAYTIIASPYLNVQASIGDTSSVVGIPTVCATLGTYLWIQTWGPCWIAGQPEVNTGGNDRQVVFRHDGSVDEHASSDDVVKFAQHAGFVLHQSTAVNSETFIMLQISI